MQQVLDFFSANKDGFIAFGVIMGAVVSVFGVWLGARASHRSRVAQLRVDWIEKLRSELNEVILLTNALRVEDLVGRPEDHHRVSEDYRNLHRCLGQIELLLNPDEPDHVALRELVFDYKIGQGKFTAEEFNIKRIELQNAFAKVAKKEWRRVKRGA